MSHVTILRIGSKCGGVSLCMVMSRTCHKFVYPYFPKEGVYVSINTETKNLVN